MTIHTEGRAFSIDIGICKREFRLQLFPPVRF